MIQINIINIGNPGTFAQLENRIPEARIGDFSGRKMSGARRDHDFQSSILGRGTTGRRFFVLAFLVHL